MTDTKAKDNNSPLLALGRGLTFDTLTAEDIENGTTAVMQRVKEGIENIIALDEARTAENTLQPLDELELKIANVAHILYKLKNLHPDSDIRDKGGEQLGIISNFSDSLFLDPELARAVQGADVEGSDETTRRLKDHFVRDFRRAGALEDEKTRNKLLKLKQKLTELSIRFSGNYNDAVGQITASPEELTGLSEEDVNRFDRDDEGNCIITTRYTDLFLILQECSNENVRERLQLASDIKAPENHDILLEILRLRKQIANILGYNGWTEFALEVKMTKTSERVSDFLNFLDEATRERSAHEVAGLEKEKAAEGHSDTTIKQHDRFYYSEKVKQKRFSLDSAKAKEYFPYNTVRDGILELYGELFGIEFIPEPNVDVWSPEVLCYNVVENGEVIARYYLDMHPREGKYQHAACGDLRPGVKDKQIPYVVLMCNFPGGPDDKGPGLMQYSQVRTFFHEFGHGIHALFAGSGKWAKFAGISTEWDFVEAPSQLLEEWLRDKQIVQRISTHYKTGEAIAADMLENILAAESYGDGFFVRRQLFLSAFAFELHTTDPEELDIAELLQDVADRYCPYPISEDAHFWTTFGHLMGYGPAYYTYMWSKVISKDLLTQFNLSNLMDGEIADKYRRKVLEPGGSKDAADLVADFLGRPYSFEPYEEWLTSGKENW